MTRPCHALPSHGIHTAADSNYLKINRFSLPFGLELGGFHPGDAPLSVAVLIVGLLLAAMSLADLFASLPIPMLLFIVWPLVALLSLQGVAAGTCWTDCTRG